MSFYMRFSGWAGDDVSVATAHLAKMFRMDSGKASQAMHKIIKGQNWQFQWPISHEQAKVAHSYLRWLGFDIELNPTEYSFRPNSRPDSIPISIISFSKTATPSLLDQLVELTGNISNAFTVALYQLDQGEKTLVLRHYISLSSNFDSKIKINLGKGPIGFVAQSRQAFLDEHIGQNQTKVCFYKKKENLKSFLAMPVIYKTLEGVLAIDSKQSYSFPVKQQKIITGLANQMAWHLNREKRYLNK